MRNLCKEINKQLIAVKMNYFFQFCVISALFVYMNPILATHGLTSYQLGITALFANACSSISRIVFGMIVDHTQHRNYVLMALSSATMGLVLMIFTLPKYKEYIFNGDINENGEFSMYLRLVSENISQSVYVTPPPTDQSDVSPCWPTTLKECKFNRYSNLTNDYYYLKTSSQNKLSAVYITNQYYPSDHVLPADQRAIQTNQTIQLICQDIETLNQSGCAHIVCEHTREAQWTTVVFALILRCLMNSMHAPISNLLDSATYSILGTSKAQYYGKSRAFGSFGFMIGSLLTGFVVHHYTTSSNHYHMNKMSPTKLLYSTTASNSGDIRPVNPNYTPALIIATVCQVIGVIASAFCNYSYTKPVEKHFTSALTTAIRSPRMIQCLMVAFMSGLIISFIGEYNYLILTTIYHVPHYFLGLLTTTSIVVEIPTLLFISGPLVKRFGCIPCQIISQIMLTIRFLCYAFSSNYWYFLIGEIAYGIYFPVLMNALLSQTEQVSLETKINKNHDILTSLQAILTSTMYGISNSLGGLLWGLLLQYFEATSLFYIAFIYTSICALFFPLVAYCLKILKC
uniref:Major facilitator superfamily associated domain-containing protein n=1 Tax=Trichobilharzia regenti TaxID=157069 RepID=A0AA85KA92_TRIRE|nr:unnamed protein product [Trichobilharzia regenti]